ncbi:MAG: YEATS-associated helix-containing protein [Pseudomonadota bacterium]
MATSNDWGEEYPEAVLEEVEMNALYLVLLIVACGALGGVGGAMGMKRSESNNSGPWYQRYLKHAFLGILAALVVPFFLAIAAIGDNGGGLISNLMTGFEQSETDGARGDWWNSLFVLVGLCILSAYAAQSFLESMASRLMKQIEEDLSDQQKRTEQVEAKVAQTQNDLNAANASLQAAIDIAPVTSAFAASRLGFIADKFPEFDLTKARTPISEEMLFRGMGMPYDESAAGLVSELEDGAVIRRVLSPENKEELVLTNFGERLLAAMDVPKGQDGEIV